MQHTQIAAGQTVTPELGRKEISDVGEGLDKRLAYEIQASQCHKQRESNAEKLHDPNIHGKVPHDKKHHPKRA